MTRAWNPGPIWQGETVAVLASGPSMNRATAQALAKYRRIVVNFTFRLAPDADMLVGLDGNSYLWLAASQFQGIKICGVDDPTVDAFYCGPTSERVKLGPLHEVEIRNSGLAAIRIAARLGATKIITAGFDPGVPGRWHLDGRPGNYTGAAQAYKNIVTELKKQGIMVARYAPSRKKCQVRP